MTTSRRHRRASGAVRRLSSGRWQARYTGSDGAMRTLATYPTKAEADQALAHGVSRMARDDLTWHDLRHSAMTLVALTGTTLPELMQHAGHSTPRAALRFQHAADDAQRRIADRLDAAVGTSVSTEN